MVKGIERYEHSEDEKKVMDHEYCEGEANMRKLELRRWKVGTCGLPVWMSLR